MKQPYVRTEEATREKMRDDARHMRPEAVYEKHANPDDILASSKNLKQAQNLKYQVNAKERGRARGNLADEVAELYRMRETNPYLKWINSPPVIIHPNIIMYDDHSINDLRAHISTGSQHPTTGNFISIFCKIMY